MRGTPRTLTRLILDNKYSSLVFRSNKPQNVASEEEIYKHFQVDGTEEASIGRLTTMLNSVGLRKDDPRLAETQRLIKQYDRTFNGDNDIRHYRVPKEEFVKCIRPSIKLISQALRNEMIIPSWERFTNKITTIFEECRRFTSGNVATYIPQLARQDPECWGVSVCTVDGQRFSLGDSNKNFCFQSVSKVGRWREVRYFQPFTYAIVSTDLGAETVHKYVGQEPSGRLFNEICLDNNDKPHNPMVNAGAIVVTSLVKTGHTMADRYDFIHNEYKKLAGGGYIGFDNATFLSERDTSARNFALAFFMKENDCFPEGVRSLREELDLYFQLCSLETDCESAAVMAATLACGGVCPLTNEVCIEPAPCRDVLSLMYSCGMYDYSGQFAFTVGLPAKSGVSGGLSVVIPNLMGISLFSPRLDGFWNSVRGVEFCRRLIDVFALHNYDSLLNSDESKLDPRKSWDQGVEERAKFRTKKGKPVDLAKLSGKKRRSDVDEMGFDLEGKSCGPKK